MGERALAVSLQALRGTGDTAEGRLVEDHPLDAPGNSSRRSARTR